MRRLDLHQCHDRRPAAGFASRHHGSRTVVAAELSLTMVAVMRRDPDGTLSRLAGVNAVAGRGQVHDLRSIDGLFVAPAADAEPAQDVTCWTFADRGSTDVLFFAGLRPLDGGCRWSDWARRVAAMVVRTPLHDVRPAAALTSGDPAPVSRAAAAAWRARMHVASLSRADIGAADDEEEMPALCVRVSLDGLESLEPLGEVRWRRMLDYCWARIVAIAGGDAATRLGDDDFAVRMTGDAPTTAQLMDAIRAALLSPVPGIGQLPALRVHFTPV